jgi:hypothetical protein
MKRHQPLPGKQQCVVCVCVCVRACVCVRVWDWGGGGFLSLSLYSGKNEREFKYWLFLCRRQHARTRATLTHTRTILTFVNARHSTLCRYHFPSLKSVDSKGDSLKGSVFSLALELVHYRSLCQCCVWRSNALTAIQCRVEYNACCTLCSRAQHRNNYIPPPSPSPTHTLAHRHVSSHTSTHIHAPTHQVSCDLRRPAKRHENEHCNRSHSRTKGRDSGQPLRGANAHGRRGCWRGWVRRDGGGCEGHTYWQEHFCQGDSSDQRVRSVRGAL